MTSLRRFLCLALLLVAAKGFAQPYVAPMADLPDGPQAAPTALGITILSNPTLAFTTLADYQNGIQLDHNTLQLTVSLGLSWSIQVRASGDLTAGVNTIPVSALGVRPISLSSRPEIQLNTTNQVLATGTALSALTNALMVIRYRTITPSAFLKPAGNYTTTLTFTYTAL
ncbi:hypothetical protein GCM10027578_26810 [Spirosoma luteolum]